MARLWRRSRGDNPGEGLASLVADQLRWARFHLGDGSAPGGVCVLPAEVLQRIRQPMVTLRTSTLGDAIGFGWFLREVDSVGTVGTGGSEVRPSVSGQRILSRSLAIGLVVSLAAHVGGSLLKSSATTEPLGLVADLLCALGGALWTGVVVVMFVQIVPEAKR